jgi:hypothetical protein
MQPLVIKASVMQGGEPVLKMRFVSLQVVWLFQNLFQEVW